MCEYGVELFVWLEEGVYFYVCGDVVWMVKDVDVVLKVIVVWYGGMLEEVVNDYVVWFLKVWCYMCDVY